MYAIVPAIDGVPQIGTRHLYEGRSISSHSEAIAYFEGDVEEGWTELTDLEYLAYWEAGIVSADKNVIAANGVDEAIVTVEVNGGLSEIKWHNADTGELISIGEVDQETNTAVLHVTMSEPGTMHIRAGQPTATKLNEVIITAR